MQLVENDGKTFSAAHEQLAEMFDDLIQIRRDPGSAPKPTNQRGDARSMRR